MKYRVRSSPSFYVNADSFYVENECVIFYNRDSRDRNNKNSVALVPVSRVFNIQEIETNETDEE